MKEVIALGVASLSLTALAWPAQTDGAGNLSGSVNATNLWNFYSSAVCL